LDAFIILITKLFDHWLNAEKFITEENSMNTMKDPMNGIKIYLVIGSLISLTGCAGFGGGGYYNDPVVIVQPGYYLFDGDYNRGRDVHNYSHRGSESRVAAHPNVRQGGSASRVAAPNAPQGVSASRVTAQPNTGQGGLESRGTAHPGGNKEGKR
jgi:hypothetical protein